MFNEKLRKIVYDLEILIQDMNNYESMYYS